MPNGNPTHDYECHMNSKLLWMVLGCNSFKLSKLKHLTKPAGKVSHRKAAEILKLQPFCRILIHFQVWLLHLNSVFGTTRSAILILFRYLWESSKNWSREHEAAHVLLSLSLYLSIIPLSIYLSIIFLDLFVSNLSLNLFIYQSSLLPSPLSPLPALHGSPLSLFVFFLLNK